MKIHKNTLIREIRVAMDRAPSLSAHTELSISQNALELDDIITQNILIALRTIEINLPNHLIDNGKTFQQQPIIWQPNQTNGYIGYIELPSDYMRLVTLRCSTWHKAVTQTIAEESPEYLKLQSPITAIAGSPQRPKVAEIIQDQKKVLECHSSFSNTATIQKAIYLPEPSFIDDHIDIPTATHHIVITTAAELTLNIYLNKSNK